MFYEHYVLLIFFLFCWIPPSQMGSFVHRKAVHGNPEEHSSFQQVFLLNHIKI